MYITKKYAYNYIFICNYTRIIKTFSKNERKCTDIKTEKGQEQDWDGTLAAKLK